MILRLVLIELIVMAIESAALLGALLGIASFCGLL